jgi:hypothetical protein
MELGNRKANPNEDTTQLHSQCLVPLTNHSTQETTVKEGGKSEREK